MAHSHAELELVSAGDIPTLPFWLVGHLWNSEGRRWPGLANLPVETEARECARTWCGSPKLPSPGESSWPMAPGLGSSSPPMLQNMRVALPGSVGARILSGSWRKGLVLGAAPDCLFWSWMQIYCTLRALAFTWYCCLDCQRLRFCLCLPISLNIWALAPVATGPQRPPQMAMRSEVSLRV